MNVFLAALADLTRADVRQRDLAAETLGDLLRTSALKQTDAHTAVTALVALIINDADPTVQESALHAIAEAFNHYELPLQLFHRLEPLLPAIPPPLLAEYGLHILAATHDPNARLTIEAFLTHPDPRVRREAANALDELTDRGSA